MSSAVCQKCGGSLRRVRRSVFERVIYSEAFKCDKCGERTGNRSFDIRYVHYVKCPQCHSVDLTVLKRRDGIDRMRKGLFNFLQRLLGGKLYHCWFCRLQFYDTRQQYNTGRKPGKNLLGPPPSDPDARVELAS